MILHYALPIEISDKEKIATLKKLVTLFQEWNTVMNLSSFNNTETIWKKHIFDSLLIGSYPALINAKHIIDIGTGGGFPGLPLAIIFPEKKFTLVDSTQKKITAVIDIMQKLHLKNVETVCERIETLARKNTFREQFDVVTERALAKSSTMLEYTLPFLRIGGTLFAYQTPATKKDLEEKKTILTTLGGSIKNILHENLPNSAGERAIFVIEKVKKTPQEFPRQTGIPKKYPL